MNAYDILKERGFIAQVTYEDDLRKAFDEGMVTFYTGFDPTADSLHIGHYIPIMAMAHLQRAGHKPDRADGRRHGHDWRPLRQERPAQGAHAWRTLTTTSNASKSRCRDSSISIRRRRTAP